jgi:hypothetical protein
VEDTSERSASMTANIEALVEWDGEGEQPTRPDTDAGVWWAQPTPPPVGGKYARAGLDVWSSDPAPWYLGRGRIEGMKEDRRDE